MGFLDEWTEHLRLYLACRHTPTLVTVARVAVLRKPATHCAGVLLPASHLLVRQDGVLRCDWHLSTIAPCPSPGLWEGKSITEWRAGLILCSEESVPYEEFCEYLGARFSGRNGRV